MTDPRSSKRVGFRQATRSPTATECNSNPDPALRQLLHQARSASAGGLALAEALWIAGEDALGVQPPAGLPALTGRVDVQRALVQQGIGCSLSDFEFTDWPPAGLAAVFYRISKEKALVHHVINRAIERLRPDGCLYLAGYRQEGFKTYLDKAAAAVGSEKIMHKGDGGVLLGQLRRGTLTAPVRLPDQDYGRLREVRLDETLSLYSKPGIFGWNKIDAGSSLLIEQLPQLESRVGSRSKTGPPRRVADLGCGYGYLSVMAARLWPAAQFMATDNHIGAVTACAANFRHAGVRGEAVAGDCGDTLEGRFDVVLCNPPFHRGFDTLGELGGRFLQRSRELLVEGGCAVFVVNQFLPLERLAAPLFSRIEVLERNRSFKVLVLQP